MATDTLASAGQSAEARWVEGELVRSFMRTQQYTRWVGPVLVAVFAGILWGDVSFTALGLWIAAALGVSAARLATLRSYHREADRLGSDSQLAFFRRTQAVWIASALVWGLVTLLYFDRSSLADQFVCWLTMAGLGMFSMNSLSSQL